MELVLLTTSRHLQEVHALGLLPKRDNIATNMIEGQHFRRARPNIIQMVLPKTPLLGLIKTVESLELLVQSSVLVYRSRARQPLHHRATSMSSLVIRLDLIRKFLVLLCTHQTLHLLCILDLNLCNPPIAFGTLIYRCRFLLQ